MKTKLLIFLITLPVIVFAQTENLKKIPGTKCSIIPPAGFVPATKFNGFQNAETGASIIITELPAPVQSIAGGFTAEALKEKGMTLLSNETVELTNSKATLLRLNQVAAGKIYLKQILVFGDSKKTVLVNAIYPESAKSNEADIKQSLLSISYNEVQADNAPETGTFKIDTEGSVFKFAKSLPGNFIYTTDGLMPTESADKAMIVVGNSLQKIKIDNRKQYSIDRLKSLPRGGMNVIKEINPVTIDNLDGFEIVADGKDAADKKQLVYQVMLFADNDEYYIFIGNTIDKLEVYLGSFKKIARTFKRK